MEFQPLCMEGLTTEMVRKAEEELGETDVVKEQTLKDLRLLIKREGKNFHPLTEDAFLLRFLRHSKFKVQRAFSTLKNYYTTKKRHSGVIMDLTPSRIKKVIDANILIPLPKRLPDGSGVIVYKVGDNDIYYGSAEFYLGACVVYWEIGISYEASQVCRAVGIIDLDNFSLSHLRLFCSPTLAYKTAKFIQNCMPIRIKALHVVNEPPFFNMVYNLAKRFLKEKLTNRIHCHGNNLASLHRFIPKEILPEEFGGTESIDYQDLQQKIQSYEAYFEKLKEYGYRDNNI